MMKNKKFSALLLTMSMLLNLMTSFVTGFAASDVEALVGAAEESGLQVDIDAAQVAVSAMLDGEDRDVFEERLDVLQKKADVDIFIDQADNLFFGDELISNDELYGNYATVDCTERVNIRRDIEPISLVENSFIIEQKIKFDDIEEDRYIYMYTDAGQLWGLNPNNGSIMGCKWASWATGNLTAGKWYNIIFEYNGADAKSGEMKYHTLSVVDLETNTVVSRCANKVEFADYGGTPWDTITKAQYLFDAYGTDSSKVYVGDLKITQETPIKAARNLVVKAERTNIRTDYDEAVSAVDKLDEGEDKASLSVRLENITAITDATTAVRKAEISKYSIDINNATSLVALLEAGDKKTNLENRLSAIVPISDDEVAASLLEYAKTTKQQADIDAAQIMISSLSDGEERSALEAEIDKIQALVDADIFIDQSSNRFFAADSISEDDEIGNYATVVCTDRVNIGSNIDAVSLVENSFKIEQKIKFDDIDEDKYLYMYTDVGQLWAINPNGGSVMGSKWASWASGNLSAGKWYNVIFEYNGADAQSGDMKYHTLSVVDLETNTVVSRRTDKVEFVDYAGVSHDSIGKLQYVFDAYETDSSKVYVGDLVVTEITDVKTARNLVVKAERTKLESDVAAAQAQVNLLPDGDEKTALQVRIDETNVFAAAVTLVVKAETTKLELDCDIAYDAVRALEDGNLKTSLLQRLDAIEVISTENAAQTLVAEAERTLAQDDIDTAHFVVLALEKGSDRTALEARLDTAQKKADALYASDYSNMNVGDLLGYQKTNLSVMEDPDDANNKIAGMTFDTTTGGGGWSPEYVLSKSITGKFVMEQKIKWTGNSCSGREFAIYARNENNDGFLMFTTFSNECGGIFYRNDWTNIAISNPMKNDTWYKIVITGDAKTKKYDIVVTDMDNGEVALASLDNTFVNEFTAITKFQYIIKGTTEASDNKLFIDDFYATEISDLILARNAVVKAERSGVKADADDAQLLIENLEDGLDKEALQARIDNLAKGLNVGKVMFHLNGESIDTIKPGKITVRTRINNMGDSEVDTNLIVGLYNGSGRMVNVKMSETEELAVGDSKTLKLEFDVTDISDDSYELRAYIWSDMVPLSTKAVLSDAAPSLTLPNFFTEDMVLQREQKHAVWGKGVEGKRVDAKLYNAENESAGSAIVKDGEWKIELDALPAGGPYTLEVSSITEKIVIENVFVGDVFVLAGQSNMEMKYWPNTCQLDNPPVDVAVNSGKIKYFSTEKVTSNSETFDIPFIESPGEDFGKWETVTGNNVTYVSAIGVYLAQEMIENNPDIPVGLMCVAWGGTDIQSWLRVSEDNETETFKPNWGGIYNNHIAPLTNYNIAGVLWYQGCQDWSRVSMYDEAFPILIDDYRRLWNREDLPFFYVQLARFSGTQFGDAFQDLTGIRESQRKALDNVSNKENIGMVVSLDTDRDTYYDIHPAGKDVIAHRLYLMIDNMIFGNNDVVYTGPLFESAEVDGNKIIVSFKEHSLGSGLKLQDFNGQNGNAMVNEIEVCGTDGVFVAAQAVINGNQVEVTIPDGIDTPVTVRYANCAVPKNPNLFNNEGLPASPFVYDFQFSNPISKIESADPAVCYNDGYYYAVAAVNSNSSIAVYKSEDLTELYNKKPTIVYTPAETDTHKKNIWAPELCYIDDEWYIYYTADDGIQSNHRMFVLKGTTQNPQDKFIYQDKLEIAEDFSIDGVPFTAPDGNLYFVWSGGFVEGQYAGNGIYIAAMESPTKMAEPGRRILISYPSDSWELKGATTNEAPSVVIKNNTVHIFFSASTASSKDYCLGRITCTNGDLLNPQSWIKSGPLLSYSDEAEVWGPGSCCFVQSPDGTETWIVYHAKNSASDGWFRQIWTQKIDWQGDYPLLPEPAGRGEMITKPSGTK